MRKRFKPKHISLALSLILIAAIMFQYIRMPRFRELPPGAVNSEWSAKIVAEGLLHSYVEELADASIYIVRREIIRERTERIRGVIVPYEFSYPNHLYTVYRVRVLDIYKNGAALRYIEGRFEMGDSLEIGDIIEVVQIKKVDINSSWPPEVLPESLDAMHISNIRSLVSFIRVPLSVGDDLILFLNVHGMLQRSPTRSRVTIFNSIQGAYRYTPQELRSSHENWVFESVNPHNNLVLTEADLQQLRNLRDSAD